MYQFCSVCNRRLFYAALGLHKFHKFIVNLIVECGDGGINGQDIIEWPMSISVLIQVAGNGRYIESF